jgi:hypothetical protein
MTDGDSHARAPQRVDLLLLKVVAAWVVPAAILTVVTLITVGKLTPVAIAVDAVGAMLLPFGLVSLVVAFVLPNDDGPPEEDDDDGWGRRPDEPGPIPPPDGEDFDWDRFEAEFRAYASAREVVV